jgi:hypothetical protein
MVLITWVDSTNHTQGWTCDTVDQMINIMSIGWLIKETEDVYVISHSIGYQGSHFDSFVIPKGCVKEVVELDKKNSKTQVQHMTTSKSSERKVTLSSFFFKCLFIFLVALSILLILLSSIPTVLSIL